MDDDSWHRDDRSWEHRRQGFWPDLVSGPPPRDAIHPPTGSRLVHRWVSAPTVDPTVPPPALGIRIVRAIWHWLASS